MKNIKRVLVISIAMLIFNSFLAPEVVTPYQNTGTLTTSVEMDVMKFTDVVKPIKWRKINGEWVAVELRRITHCNDEGDDCIIGPTITGPC